LSAEEKRFELLYAPIRRSLSRGKKIQISRRTFNRIENANFAAAIPVAHADDKEPSLSDVPASETTDWDDIPGWDEQGDVS